MFEFEKEFLFSLKREDDAHRLNPKFCMADNAAHDELAELARLVGGGGNARSDDGLGGVQIVDDAPALEFDLEDELTKAFGAAENAAPAVEPAPVAAEEIEKIIQASLASPQADVEPAPIPKFIPAASEFSPPSTEPEAQQAVPTGEAVDEIPADFDATIGDELERALAQEISSELDMSVDISADDPVMQVEPAIPSATSTAPEGDADLALELSELFDGETGATEQSADDFAKELSRLMGGAGEAAPANPAPTNPAPVPSQAVMPADEPQIVQPAHIPELPVEPAVSQQVPPAYEPPHTSDFTAPQNDYSDPAADLNALLSQSAPPSQATPAPQPVSTAPLMPESEISVEEIAAGAAVGAAAIAASANPPKAAPTEDYAIDPALFAEMEANFHNSVQAEQAEPDQVHVPAPHEIGATEESSNKGRKAAFAVVALALLGGVFALSWSSLSGEDGPAPTILASSDPVKVKPAEAGGKVVPNQDQSVYNSVDGSASVQPQQARLNETAEKPIEVPTSKTDARIAQTDSNVTGALDLKPRRVRTLVVKPDGTIVSTSADQTTQTSAKVEDASSSVDTGASSTTVLKPVSTRTVSLKTSLVPEPKQVKVQPVEVAKVEPKVVKVETAEVKPAAKPEVKKTETKAVNKETGLPSVSSPFAVQVSSQRSAAAAKKSYATVSRRYASILSGKGVDIRKATVNGKGTYYRVRIPANSRAAANQICSQLKAQGGACFVTR